MHLLDQHAKAIMEECKVRARNAGLDFDHETLEYIVSNKDMLELSPKVMIPTLYDYWVNDVEVLKEYGKYKLYPTNPYETVINSRPAISFYNDNNPDWMNIMIFYHVIGHIDFFQNNRLFEHTWNDDFVGVALADKRLIESYRSRYGRWTDYVVEFARSIDNITGYFQTLARMNYDGHLEPSSMLNFYFNTFLPDHLKEDEFHIFKEQQRYNTLFDSNPKMAESTFFAQVKSRHPEFESAYKNAADKAPPATDLLEFLIDHSPFLKQEKNRWMKSVMTVIRNTALYFAPQMRTKIVNEGWASYWHDKLFRGDNRIIGHEVAYSALNAGVTSLSRVGLNPYAIGLRLLEYVEELADKGKMSREYQKLILADEKEAFDKKTGNGQEAIYKVREKFSDFMLINTFVNQEFVDRHNLFVTGKRPNPEKGVIEYYVKSRKAEDYKKMLIDSLYHPPVIRADVNKTTNDSLYLVHAFEGKQLIKDFIPEVLIGLNFLWGDEVKLETTEIMVNQKAETEEEMYSLQKVLYACKDKKVTKSKVEENAA
ncbi:MAG: SpoVR family protein [Marinilabiliales bacterium]|nr:MAG: SpoVR family protein [Marinilabiliales bacterium]